MIDFFQPEYPLASAAIHLMPAEAAWDDNKVLYQEQLEENITRIWTAVDSALAGELVVLDDQIMMERFPEYLEHRQQLLEAVVQEQPYHPLLDTMSILEQHALQPLLDELQHLTNPLLDQDRPQLCGNEKWGSPELNFWRPGANPTVDMVAVWQDQVLLVKRSKNSEAFPGSWALPGGFHDTKSGKGESWQAGHETAQQAALRELTEETGLDADSLKPSMHYLGFFDHRSRDPRNCRQAWSVTNAFRLDLPNSWHPQVEGMDDADEAKWVELKELENMALAFDHADILRQAGILP